MTHTEALFLVDDQQTEGGELQMLGEQGMGAHEDVDVAVAGLFQNGTFFSGTAKAIHAGDFNAKAFKALCKGLPVLVGENGGWCQHRDLVAALYHFKGGAEGDFRFAKSHVAAQQTIHGIAGLQAAFDFP